MADVCVGSFIFRMLRVQCVGFLPRLPYDSCLYGNNGKIDNHTKNLSVGQVRGLIISGPAMLCRIVIKTHYFLETQC